MKWRCKVCGYIHEGPEPPEICPVCGAPRSEFELVQETGGDRPAAGASAAPVVLPPGDGAGLSGPDAAKPVLGLVSYGLFVVSSRRGEVLNGQIANTVFQITSEPPRLAIGVNKRNLTHEFMNSSLVAALTVLGQDNLGLVPGFGFRSGRDADKFAGLEVQLSSEVGCPVLSTGLAFLEVRLDRGRSYDVGTHTLFVADVVGGGKLRDGVPMTYAWYRENRGAAGPGATEPNLARDVTNSVTALNLEFSANRRYQHQISTLQNPRLNAVLEGVMRTEGDHVDSALAFIERNTPQATRGFRRSELYLQLNLDFERIAADTYRKFAAEAADPERKATFKDMTQSEVGHVNIFRQTLEEVRAGRFPVLLYCELCGWEVDFGQGPTEGAEQRCARCGAKFGLVEKDGDWGLARL